MLEARRAYRNAVLADRVKVVNVNDPGPNANLNDPRLCRPPPLSSSSSSSDSSPDTRRPGPTVGRGGGAGVGESGSGGRGGGSGHGHGPGASGGGSGYSTATPENTRSTRITLFPTRSAPSQPTASSSSTGATRVASVPAPFPKTERTTQSQSQSQVRSGTGSTSGSRSDAVSPPTVGTVQNASDNLSVSSERRRHGTGNVKAKKDNDNVTGLGGYEYSRTSSHSSRRSNYSRTMSILSSPLTGVTQVESGPGSTLMSSRHLSSLPSPAVGPVSGATPETGPLRGSRASSSSGSGKSSSKGERRQKASSSRPLIESISESAPLSSATLELSADSPKKSHSDRSSSSKHTSRSRVEPGSTSDRERRHRRTHSSITTGTVEPSGSTRPSKPSRSSHSHHSHRSKGTSSPPSRSRTDDPDWSPKTDVTYYESGGEEPSVTDRHDSVEQPPFEHGEHEYEGQEDDGFATAPSSPDLPPTTPPVMDYDGPVILHSLGGSSPSSLSGSVTERWSSDRVNLISNSNRSDSPKRVLPRRTFSEVEIQTATEAQTQTEVYPVAQSSSSTSICPTCQCHCHQSQPRSQSQSSSAVGSVGGDTVPATPANQPVALYALSPLNNRLEFVGDLGALGLSSLSVPNVSHSPRLDPRSPIARSTSLPAK